MLIGRADTSKMLAPARGTEIEFIYKNYDKDPVTGLVRYDHLGLMKIK